VTQIDGFKSSSEDNIHLRRRFAGDQRLARTSNIAGMAGLTSVRT
jgi:hypothetical protein